MDPHTIWNVVLSVGLAAGGWFLRELSATVHSLRAEDAKLSERVQQIALVVAGDYVRKTDFDRFTEALFQRFDRLESKLDHKADKP